MLADLLVYSITELRLAPDRPDFCCLFVSQLLGRHFSGDRSPSTLYAIGRLNVLLVRRRWLRADYRLCEQRWLELARSYEQKHRLILFINESSKRKMMDIERRPTVDADGLAAGAARVKMTWSNKAGHAATRVRDQLITTVDDDQFARAGLRCLIESPGHPVAVFESAEEYLVSDTRDSTACLILDVHLRSISGPDLQAHLIAGGWCPPTVFVTGWFEQDVQKRGTAAGAIGYLTKPCDEKTLFDCIDKALGATR